GGLMALVQVVLSDLVSPRERGRYMGYLGSVMAVGTVGGPLLGGVITDSALGWRWCFFVGVPIAAAAFVVLQRTLHLPERPRRKVRIDYLGAGLISAGISALLIWVSLAGHQFDWLSWQTAVLVLGGIALLGAAVRVEVTRDEPLIPTHLFRERVPVLAAIASASVGVALFGVAVFLSQYLQISRGESPTASGLLTIPMMIGILISSTLVGRRISKTGRYKKFMVTGAVLLTTGLALMGMLDEHTSLVELGVFMALVGLGVGMVMQNLVLVVQNAVPLEDIGAASALITFSRSLGGATGVSVLGAILGSRASSQIADGLAAQGISTGAVGGGTTSIPDVNSLPGPVLAVVQHAYASGTAEIFMVAAPLTLVALIAIALLPEVPLGTRSGSERLAEDRAGEAEAEPVPPAAPVPA
ncbi:MAG TPA: MFS transporter, partial [Thermoleophilaceae bacterium]|nr:MFS transporter [Thermoleophilaceae bacterium]